MKDPIIRTGEGKNGSVSGGDDIPAINALFLLVFELCREIIQMTA